ncbi:MAG: lipid IV(A) 3-deoxy-D-manno-octulosonic acid transferase [Herminiimonas sp.]|uniref:lipid IV(A) 3-deoxy-D-manno-octulosonic acid transferase n=1 Tax=Herminiimonas sp. TaxID=1926289 RepID=UPI00271AECF1|nr:lipid IV(A) 3-deoxy-D-manno-octulosonic acid transferase [Herminiimonas sp.]MDO9419367.1 lipid IV(A) 3-deoxy-D-manno-octulosonic acid transferase [Herminiimonas sp.]
MRLIYSIAWWFALPLVLLRLFVRGRKEPGYRQHIAERLGFYGGVAYDRGSSVLWVHAVSVGETRAAQPLIDALLATYPTHTLLLTHMTPTGRATGKDLFGTQSRVVQSYLPYDTGFMVGRFLRYFKPKLCILMETEVWPNVMAQCARHAVPVALVNARLSDRSLNKALRLPGLFVEAAAAMSCVAAQTESDAVRIRQLGAPAVHVTGSIKFDVRPPSEMLQRGATLRQQIGSRPVLVCANTRDGEEALILDALLQQNRPEILLLLVPRHPQRFNDVAQMISARSLQLARRSTIGSAEISPDVRVFLGDSMGEMFAYYAACDVAFVGGSLLPLGGHNLIEASAMGKPVLIGPHTFNFADAAENAIAAGGAQRVTDASDMWQHAIRLLDDVAARTTMGEAGQKFAQQHGGATARTMALLAPLIN